MKATNLHEKKAYWLAVEKWTKNEGSVSGSEMLFSYLYECFIIVNGESNNCWDSHPKDFSFAEEVIYYNKNSQVKNQVVIIKTLVLPLNLNYCLWFSIFNFKMCDSNTSL